MADLDNEGVDQETPEDGPELPSPPPLSAWPPPPPAAATPPTPPDDTRRGRRRFIAAALAALLLVGAGAGITLGLTRGTFSTTSTRSGSAASGLDVQAIAARLDAAVVDVNTVITDGFGRTGQGAGTGMVVSSSGQILTNNHVIEGATKIVVTFSGRSGSYPANVVGVDPSDDVALLQVNGLSGLPTVTLGDSSGLSIGQEVVAIGNALGQGGSPTVTTGTVTALERSITVGGGLGGPERLSGLIQTDAPIQPGDSGGPLVDSSGRVIGIITAAARSGSSQEPTQVGFAIPTNDASAIVSQIRAGHETPEIIIGQPGFLGVGVQDLDPQTAARLGLGNVTGAFVLRVQPETPAAAAGISRNAVITAIDGVPIRSADQLGTAIRKHDPGEQIRVTWSDQAGTHTATVRLIAGPAI